MTSEAVNVDRKEFFNSVQGSIEPINGQLAMCCLASTCTITKMTGVELLFIHTSDLKPPDDWQLNASDEYIIIVSIYRKRFTGA